MNKTLYIIPAAGQATRLRPISNRSSKCMVPVNGKPIISYIIDKIDLDTSDVIIVHGDNTDVVSYCEKKYGYLKISFARQTKTQGPLHAVYCGLQKVNDLNNYDKVIIWLGDTIVDSEDDISDDHSLVVSVKDWQRWCFMDFDGKLYDKPEKQPPTDLALIGVYCFSDYKRFKEVTDEICERSFMLNGEYQISQLLERMGNRPQVILSSEWYDCGDLPSLYDSSARILKKRACRPGSSVSIDTISGTFTKAGKRCENEVYWYNNVPDKVKPFIPNVYKTDDLSYTMELLPSVTVADMLVFEDMPEDSIRYIINRCLDTYRLAFNTHDKYKNDSEGMFFTKNFERVTKYKKLDIHQQEINEYLRYTQKMQQKYSSKLNGETSCVHGDYHLGNIMFSPETGRVKMIDPRGNWGLFPTIHGNYYYDFVKFMQSIYGEYIWLYPTMDTNINVRDICMDEAGKWFGKNNFDFEMICDLVPIIMGSCLEFHDDSKTRQDMIWDKTLQIIRNKNV